MLAQQAAALDQLDKQRQQQQQQAAAGSSGSREAAAAGDSSRSSSKAAAQASPQQQQRLPQQEGSVQASLEAAGVPSEIAAAADAALKLDDDTLASVSRAIMGRLDIVDLVGRNTAYEVAERVSSWFRFLVGGAFEHMCTGVHSQ
jgi:ATPase subunit of ABC transporter with duplicated ATPase domains